MVQLTDNELALLMALCKNSFNGVITFAEDKDVRNVKEAEEHTWYLDNGASNHMTGYRDKFEGLEKTI